jgi:tetrahydromethanopterin S-methyltransferase subunit C
MNHWEIDYRKIIGIYQNFDGKLLHSYFTTVSEVFLELLLYSACTVALLRPFQRCLGANSSKYDEFVAI